VEIFRECSTSVSSAGSEMMMTEDFRVGLKRPPSQPLIPNALEMLGEDERISSILDKLSDDENLCYEQNIVSPVRVKYDSQTHSTIHNSRTSVSVSAPSFDDVFSFDDDVEKESRVTQIHVLKSTGCTDEVEEDTKTTSADDLKSINDEILEIDDCESPLAISSRFTDQHLVCEYPVGLKGGVIVSISDYKTLQYDTFLNDIIVDFYLTWLYNERLCQEERSKVHIFSSLFYTRLVQKTDEKSSVSSVSMHEQVKRWTKNVNLFDKRMAIIPICEHSHWYVILVINPGLIQFEVGSAERNSNGDPYLLVLDSLGGSKSSTVTNIRNYLRNEWKAKRCEEGGDECRFSAKEMKAVVPKKPEQDNYSDCGIFLLHYIEMVFKNMDRFYWPAFVIDLNDWFGRDEIVGKRMEIASLIRCLSKSQNFYTREFPDLPFLPLNHTGKEKKVEKISTEEISVDNSQETSEPNSRLKLLQKGVYNFYDEKQKPNVDQVKTDLFDLLVNRGKSTCVIKCSKSLDETYKSIPSSTKVPGSISTILDNQADQKKIDSTGVYRKQVLPKLRQPTEIQTKDVTQPANFDNSIKVESNPSKRKGAALKAFEEDQRCKKRFELRNGESGKNSKELQSNLNAILSNIGKDEDEETFARKIRTPTKNYFLQTSSNVSFISYPS